MKNLKIGEISSSGQKQGENTKIGKFPQESGRLGSHVMTNGLTGKLSTALQMMATGKIAK